MKTQIINNNFPNIIYYLGESLRLPTPSRISVIIRDIKKLYIYINC